MRDVQKPANQSLDSHAERRVRYAADLMNIADELVPRIRMSVFVAHPLFKHGNVVNLLGCA